MMLVRIVQQMWGLVRIMCVMIRLVQAVAAKQRLRTGKMRGNVMQVQLQGLVQLRLVNVMQVPSVSMSLIVIFLWSLWKILLMGLLIERQTLSTLLIM